MTLRIALACLVGLAACHPATRAATPPRPPREPVLCADADGDGFTAASCGGQDCDDADPAVNPGASELCNGADDDCDGSIDESCACDPGDSRPCYPGGLDSHELWHGLCRAGHEDCMADGTGWSDCLEAVVPVPEGTACDGLDQDCNGIADDDLTNACGTCGSTPPETCGNGLDEDCNGLIDDPSICNLSCAGVDVTSPPPGYGCCAGSRPTCATVDCEGRTGQPCYSGPPATAGKGNCHGGTHSCSAGPDGVVAWSACQGEQLPAPEICGDGLDQDCDGLVDEGCSSMAPERCGDGIDTDGNGNGGPGEPEDRGCCVPAGDEVCNGLDDDCDGLADEGVVNACGKCGDETCQVIEIHEPANCAEGSDRICSRIIPDPNDPDAFTLGSDSRGRAGTNVAYFPVVDLHAVVKLDTITGQKLWQVDSSGDSPGEAAVPLDDSVWVVNQGLGDPVGSSLVHLDRDGNLVCRAPLPGGSWGLTIDPDGKVWVGTADPAAIRAFDGLATDGVDESGLPRCMAVGNPVNLPEPISAMASDDRGILWTASPTERTVRLDIATGAQEVIRHRGPTTGVTIADEEVPWFAGDPVHFIDPDGPYSAPASYEHDVDFPGASITTDPDALWGISGNRLIAFHEWTGGIDSWLLPAKVQPAPGLQPDDAGKMWVPLADGRALRFDPVTEESQAFDVAPGHELEARGSFITASGRPFLYYAQRQGTWTQILDGSYPGTFWTKLEWSVFNARNAVVEVHARFSPTRDGLDTTSIVCGPYDTSPADLLHDCPGARGQRFAAMEIALRSRRPGRPSVGNIRISLTRP